MFNKKKTSLRVFPDNWIDPFDFKRSFPESNRPLEVDIGSGKGRFLTQRALSNPHINFLGIERQLIRVNRSGRKCERRELNNVRILRMECYYAVKYLIPDNYISNYYIFFPDPWPKGRHHRHRLLNRSFIDSLYHSLIKLGCVHITTDHMPYFNLVYQTLNEDNRFSEVDALIPKENEKTDFELLYTDKPIGRCSFCKN